MMTLLRVVSAATVFGGVFVGVLQIQEAALIGTGLIVIGLLLMLAIARLDRRPAPRHQEIPVRPAAPPDN